MSAEVSVLGPCSRKVRISISAAEVKQHLENGFRQAGQNVQMKGFRPGKIPRHILEKKYGEAIRQEVKQQIIQEAWREAIDSHDLRPVEAPKVDTDSIKLDNAEDIALEFTIEVRPDFELPDWKTLEVGAPVATAQDADLERELERLRARFAKPEPLAEGVAAKGDYLIADVAYRVDGAVVAQHDTRIIDTHNDVIDRIPAGGGTASFLGKAAGAAVTVAVKLPDDFEPKGFAGADAQLECTVKEIRRVALPELDDAFAKQVGAENLEDLRTRMRAEIERALKQQRDRYVEERLFDQLIQKTPFDLPQNLLERATHEAVHHMEHQLQHNGVEATEAKAQAAAETERLRGEQTRALRVSFIIDRIAEKESLGVTEEELEKSVVALAMAHNRPAQEVFDELYESGRLNSLRAQVLESKVRKLLRESAKVIDAKTESA